MRIVLSSTATISSERWITRFSSGSRCPPRWIEATQSRASTGVPSWNFNPSRSVSVYCLPSFSTFSPASICNCGCNFASSPYSVSNTAIE